MNTLARNGQRDSYEYLVLAQQVDMMEAAGVTGVQYNHFWVELEKENKMTKFIKTVEALAGVALVSIYAVIFVKVIAGMITKKFDPWLGIEITSGKDYAVAITSAVIMMTMIGGLVVLICIDIYKNITGKSKKEN